jgi:hypothetical protein
MLDRHVSIGDRTNPDGHAGTRLTDANPVQGRTGTESGAGGKRPVNPDVLLAVDATAHAFKPHGLVERPHDQMKGGDDDVGRRCDRSRLMGGLLISNGGGKGSHPLAVDHEINRAHRPADVFCRRRHIGQTR